MLQDVLVEPLKIISDERGAVMHMLRSDASFFKRFGEVYFSVVNAGVIKGWKQHKLQTQHFAVPEGHLRLVLFDAREDSTTYNQIQEVHIGESNYCLVRIPPGIIYGFQAVGDQKALVANCVDIPHSPEEAVTFDLNDQRISFSWI